MARARAYDYYFAFQWNLEYQSIKPYGLVDLLNPGLTTATYSVSLPRLAVDLVTGNTIAAGGTATVIVDNQYLCLAAGYHDKGKSKYDTLSLANVNEQYTYYISCLIGGGVALYVVVMWRNVMFNWWWRNVICYCHVA